MIMDDERYEKLSWMADSFFKAAFLAIGIFVLSLLSFPAHAAATPSNWDEVAENEVLATDSNASKEEIDDQILNLLDELNYDELDEQTQLELLSLYIESLGGPGSSASNASLANIETLLSDIHTEIVPANVEDSADAVAYSLEDETGVMVYALSDEFSLDRNVVIYEGIWNGQSARLVLPADYASTLYIDDSGNLYNVGTENITGRIFYDDFDPLSYECDVFTLTPCLGSNASTLYSYGYPSYNRHYYVSNSRVTYDTVYGLFNVENTVYTPSDLPANKNGIYLLVLILIGGVCFLCLWKK